MESKSELNSPPQAQPAQPIQAAQPVPEVDPIIEFLQYLDILKHQQIYKTACRFYQNNYGLYVDSIPPEIPNLDQAQFIKPQELIEALTTLQISPNETHLYWLAKIYYLLPLPLNWSLNRDNIDSISFKFRTQVKSRFPPCILYIFYLANFNRNNNSKHSIYKKGQEIITYKNSLGQMEEINLKQMYENTLNNKSQPDKLKLPTDKVIAQQPNNTWWKNQTEKLIGKHRLFSDDKLFKKKCHHDENPHPNIIEVRSNLAHYTPTDTKQELHLENYWFNSRNADTQLKRENEEILQIVDDWAVAKSKVSQEINRKIDSSRYTTISHLRTYLPGYEMRPSSSYNSNSKKSIGKYWVTSSTSTLASSRPDSYKKTSRPNTSHTNLTISHGSIKTLANWIRPQTATSQGNPVNLLENNQILNNFQEVKVPQANTKKPLPKGRNTQSSRGVQSNVAIKKKIIDPVDVKIQMKEAEEAKTKNPDLKDVRQKIDFVKSMYGNFIPLKTDEILKSNRELKSLSVFTREYEDNLLRRPQSAITARQPFLQSIENTQNENIKAIKQRFSDANLKVPANLEAGLKHPIIQKEMTSEGIYPLQGRRLPSNPMLVIVKPKRRPASSKKKF